MIFTKTCETHKHAHTQMHRHNVAPKVFWDFFAISSGLLSVTDTP